MNNTTPTEFIKVVVASLDYSDSGGQPNLTRLVLHKALTSTNEPARRWCTRFLGAIASQRLPDFFDWGILLLLGQLGDESVKVVRQTIRMLHQWLPMYPQSVKNLRAVPLNAFGEAGTLLKAYLYADEDICISNHDVVMEGIHTWMTGFNTRYFESLDEDMRVCLLNVKRSITGGFSRVSHERLRFGVRAPAHLFGSLAKHHYGRELLKSERVIRQLLAQLGEEKDMALVKGAVIALGQIGSTTEGAELFPPDVIPRMIRLAEEFPTLSVRGAAFWALNMIGTSEVGAKLLCEYGWESNQHKWVVDEIRKKYEGDEDEERRPTATAQIVPEVSISFDKATAQQQKRMDSPASRKNSRARSSSESCWAPQKLIMEQSRLRRSGSDSGFEYPTIDSPLMSEYDSDNVRSRAMTSESGITSGLSSSWIDESIGNRRRATTTTSQCEDPANESRSRSSTIARCLSQGLTVEKSRLETEGTVADLLRDPHFSTKYREKWRLAPFKTRRFLQVNRNIGDPVRYIFMTKGEEECVAAYRYHLMNDSWLQRHLQATALSGKSQVMQPVYIAALPSEVQVMCGNIFHLKKLFSDENDRGAKSGHSKNQRTDPALAHSSYRCFYCASNGEKYPLPPQVDVAALRRQVLNEVDMLEIKETPERKLIHLRAAHPWLFEWPCLYADVLELLDEYRFKPRSRSFLQEIFYDALKL